MIVKDLADHPPHPSPFSLSVFVSLSPSLLFLINAKFEKKKLLDFRKEYGLLLLQATSLWGAWKKSMGLGCYSQVKDGFIFFSSHIYFQVTA